jgi:ABC-2 type transport system ATP-binding protein
MTRKEAEARAGFLLETFKLNDKRDDLVQNLSTGQKMKVAFCRALVHDPPLLLVDEAERGLDPRASKEFRNFLKNELQEKQGKTILLCTHNMEILDELCDRIALINKGSIIALDTPDRLKRSLKQKHILKVHSKQKISREIFSKQETIGQVKTDFDGEYYCTDIELSNGVVVTDILEEIYRNKIQVIEFNMKTTTLEDVFLKLTGRSLDDETEGMDD